MLLKMYVRAALCPPIKAIGGLPWLQTTGGIYCTDPSEEEFPRKELCTIVPCWRCPCLGDNLSSRYAAAHRLSSRTILGRFAVRYLPAESCKLPWEPPGPRHRFTTLTCTFASYHLVEQSLRSIPTLTGTPLICLYYLGWIMGKHPFFLSIAFAAVLFSWGNFWVLSLEEGGANFWEMWVANVAVFFLHSACFFVWRVFKRVPRRSAGFWFALLLETGLVNTLTCVAHGVGFWLLKGGGLQDAKNDAAVLRLAAFSSPFVLWFVLRRVVLARQDAFIRRNNLAAQAGRKMCCARTCAASQEARAAAGLVIRDIIEKSMDLRMTGLSRKELGRLADCLGNESAAAVLIRFYTVRVDSREKFYLLLSSFHQGYEYTPEPDRCSDSDGLTKWCEDWAESSCDHPWKSVRRLAGCAEPPEGSPLGGCPCGHPKDQIWWLCGAIAKVSDMSMGTEHRQYALMAAALSMNQDPLAIIMAGGRAAEGRLRKIRKGWAEVLRQIDPDAQRGEEERGAVFTDAKEGGSPVVMYSPSEAWHAASVRGAFMLGREAFDLLWNEPGYHALHPEELNRIRRNDKEWSSKVRQWSTTNYPGELHYAGV